MNFDKETKDKKTKKNLTPEEKKFLIVISTIMIMLVLFVICISTTISSIATSMNKAVSNTTQILNQELKDGESYYVPSTFISIPTNILGMGQNSISVVNSNLIYTKNFFGEITKTNININNAPSFGILINLYVNLEQARKDISINNTVSNSVTYNLNEIYNNNKNNLGISLNLSNLFKDLKDLNDNIEHSNYSNSQDIINKMQGQLIKFINYAN